MGPTNRANSVVSLELAQHLRGLRGRALQLCGNADQAEDLLQDTVERALKFQHSFVPGTNLRAWMHRILTTIFISKKRRSARERRALELLVVDPCAWIHGVPSPDANAMSPQVERAVGRLPDKFREVVSLVDLSDMSYRDAALELSVPLGTVMSRLHRGRRQLAASLGPNEAGEAAQAA